MIRGKTPWLVPIVLAIAVLTTPMASLAQPKHAVDEHLEALGGLEALSEVKTLVRSGTARMSGVMGDQEGTFEEVFDFESELGATTLDLGVFVQDSGWVGNEAWQQNSFEGMKEMAQGDLDFAKMTARPSALAYLRSQYGLAAFVEAEERERDGKPMVLLRIIGSPAEFYVDKKTQLLETMLIPGILEVTYDDYRVVDGIKLPFSTSMDIVVAGFEISYLHEETELDATVDPQRFEKPDA